MMSLPVWLPGPMFLLGGVSDSGPMFLLGVSVHRGLCVGGSLSVGLLRLKTAQEVRMLEYQVRISRILPI